MEPRSERMTNQPHMIIPWTQTHPTAPEFGHDGLPSALAQLHHDGGNRSDLDEGAILDWADAFYAIHGEWPRWDSGPIPESPGETWFTVSAALVLGQRGFPPGGSLAGLFVRHGRFQYRASDKKLTVGQIMAWAKAWYRRTGRWPSIRSGEIPGQGGMTWRDVNTILRSGRAGRPAGTTLYLLRSGKCLPAEQTPLTENLILAWADAHHERTGKWPAITSGCVLDAPGESWLAVSHALMRGSRSLRRRSSLSALLRKHRAIMNTSDVPPLSIPQILVWADAHHARTGKWPTHLAGQIPEAPAESWNKVQSALVAGTRGLPGGSSLAQLLTARRGLRNPQRLPELTISQVLTWSDAFHARTGHWPKFNSGPIPESPGETWCSVASALRKGVRGLPTVKGIGRFLAEHRAWRVQSRRPTLTVPQVWAWAKAFHARTGRWPNRTDGPILDAPGETWMAIHRALQTARRGLPRYPTLARFIKTKLAKIARSK